MKLSRLSTVSLLLVLVSGTAGCALVNRVRAKNALNEGARAYKDGNFALAEEKFRYAYEMDPTQQAAPIFIARAVQQQYKPGVPSPENVAIGEKAISAYQDILNRDPSNEDAYKAVVFLYGQMKNDQKVHEMLTQRANLASAAPERRAEAYTILASKQWQCSYDITELKENKSTENKPDRVLVHYKKPANQADFDKARGCVTEGLKLAEQAISLDANSANAWSYKTNLLREASKLAEMEGNQQAKEDYDKQHAEALERQTVLAEAARKKREAADAAKSPTPPPS
ncbi:MAG TPA: hypothetical protein VK422_13695 [Pyrinomonadaceae bacterium]|nr:hypothetical protein [Pyrinomonadaceae bacterium]